MIRSLGNEVLPATLPMPDLGALIDAESYAYHAEFLDAHAHGYDPRTRDGLLSGTPSSRQEVERLRRPLASHRASVHQAFSRVDLVVLPSLPVLPLKISDCIDPFAMPTCTFGFSLGGLPCISVPCGFSPTGLPIGLLSGGPPLADGRVSALPRAFEASAKWHLQRPVLQSPTVSFRDGARR